MLNTSPSGSSSPRRKRRSDVRRPISMLRILSPDNRSMNPLLDKLQPYPFERLRQLFAGVTPNPKYRAISLGIGEPKHPTPQFIKDALVAGLDGLAHYPLT